MAFLNVINSICSIKILPICRGRTLGIADSICIANSETIYFLKIWYSLCYQLVDGGARGGVFAAVPTWRIPRLVLDGVLRGGCGGDICEMAAVTDCFTLGSTVWCRTCYNQEIEGDVLAFDEQTKILILKCPTASGINNLHDVQFINLALVSELQVKKEVTTPPEGPQSLNLQRLNTRIRNQVDEKKRLLTSLSSSVPPEGQRLFVAISKMLKEVQWRNADIVVWNSQVIITPPYQVENVKGNTESKEFSYIKKLVEKHNKDTALSQTTSGNSQVVVQHNANMQ